MSNINVYEGSNRCYFCKGNDKSVLTPIITIDHRKKVLVHICESCQKELPTKKAPKSKREKNYLKYFFIDMVMILLVVSIIFIIISTILFIMLFLATLGEIINNTKVINVNSVIIILSMNIIAWFLVIQIVAIRQHIKIIHEGDGNIGDFFLLNLIGCLIYLVIGVILLDLMFSMVNNVYHFIPNGV